MAKEFLKGFLPLMVINFFVTLGILAELKDGGALLPTIYFAFLFPFLIAPISVGYFLLNKKHPVRAKGVMASLIITFLSIMLIFFYETRL